MSGDEAPRTLYLVLLLMLVASSLVGMRLPVGKVLKMFLAWVAIFAVAPVSGIYYPIATLPGWLQPVAWVLPSSYVFEGMRAVLLEQQLIPARRAPAMDFREPPRSTVSLRCALPSGPPPAAKIRPISSMSAPPGRLTRTIFLPRCGSTSGRNWSVSNTDGTSSTNGSDLLYGGDGQDAFTAISRALVGSERQFAIVLDGAVISPHYDSLLIKVIGFFQDPIFNSIPSDARSLVIARLDMAGGRPDVRSDIYSVGVTF